MEQRFFTANALILSSAPEVGDMIPHKYMCEIVNVRPIDIDPQQGNDEIWNYSFYKVEYKHNDDEEAENGFEYVAVENDFYEEEEEEEEEEENE